MKMNVMRYEPSTVFLGGTCNGSSWRSKLIKLLDINYYNPVVDDWTEECKQEEIRQRNLCDYCLYTITPKMTGVYSIAELVYDSCKQPEKTIFCLLVKDGDKKFTKGQMKSLLSVAKLVISNNVLVFTSLKEVAKYLKGQRILKVESR